MLPVGTATTICPPSAAITGSPVSTSVLTASGANVYSSTTRRMVYGPGSWIVLVVTVKVGGIPLTSEKVWLVRISVRRVPTIAPTSSGEAGGIVPPNVTGPVARLGDVRAPFKVTR